MRPIATDVARYVVSVTGYIGEPRKTAEPTEMPLGGRTRVQGTTLRCTLAPPGEYD